jgi:hypothetical protein
MPAGHGLISRVPGRRVATDPAAVDTVARRLGEPALVDEVLARFRAARPAWRAQQGLVGGLGARTRDPCSDRTGRARGPGSAAGTATEAITDPIELRYEILGAIPIAT